MKTEADHLASGRRGGKLRSATFRYSIEGEMVLMTDIAARAGCGVSTAQKRVKREQGKRGPVTWAGLAEAGR